MPARREAAADPAVGVSRLPAADRGLTLAQAVPEEVTLGYKTGPG